MSQLTYEQARSQMPHGWTLWGNHGDGKWRAGRAGQESLVVPAESMAEAVARARAFAAGDGEPRVLAINPSTSEYQLAAHQATLDGNRPGSHGWWSAIRSIKAEWVGIQNLAPEA